MALHTFEVNDASGVTCKKCIEKKSLMVPNIGDSLSVLCPEGCFQSGDSCSSTDFFAGTLLTDQGTGKPLNDDLQSPDKVTLQGSFKVSEPSKSGLVFLFEKKLTLTDCDSRSGRFLVPKPCAEKYLPIVRGQQRMPVAVRDIGGQLWQFTLRWWLNKNSRKYVLDGTKRCIKAMQWNVGDTLKFYRKLPEGELIMELQRAHASTSPR